MWYKYKCQYCQKEIKCNSTTIGSTKIQLKSHETKCARNRNLSNANVNYLVTQDDVNNIQFANNNIQILTELPQVITNNFTKLDNEEELSLKVNDIDSIYNNKCYRKEFSKLPYIFRWDNGGGLWNIYSMESQYILNNADENSVVHIYEYNQFRQL